MQRILPVGAVLFLLLAYGVAEGLWTDRWSISPQLAEAEGRLAKLPETVGLWQGTDEEMDPRQVSRAELRAFSLRRYVHSGSGEALTVLTVCGRPGPIAVHSPEVCYGGSGFTPAGARVRHQIESPELNQPAEFWSERYEKKGAIPEYLQIYYGWNSSKGWQAVDNPRVKFAPARALFKVYVVRRLSRADEPREEDPIPDFLRLFVPQLDRCLFDSP